MQQKKKYFLGLLIFFFGHATYAFEEDLQVADSLFKTQKYIEAFGIYENLLENHGLFSPQMLLKMAYVQESLDNIPATLYYLTLYQKHHSEIDIFQRMEDLARRENLIGYAYKDTNFFETLHARYRLPVTWGGIGFAVLGFLLLGYRSRQGISRNLSGSLLLLLLLTTLWYNYSPSTDTAILYGDQQIYLMDSPSAGGQVLGTLTQGNRLPLQGKTDIWWEVNLEDRTAYVREHQAKVVR